MREEEELSEVTLVREDQGGPVGPQDHPHHLQPYHHVGGRRGEKTLPRGRGKGQEMEGEMREGEGLGGILVGLVGCLFRGGGNENMCYHGFKHLFKVVL